MIEQEVEDTLREIRERVLAGSSCAAHAPDASTINARTLARPDAGVDEPGGALARLQANLAVTARAWSRLPPLLSYRQGFAARVELWLKRQVKRATHWFTWEQINFNSAVHHALGDVHAALSAHERAQAQTDSELARIHSELAALRGVDSELARVQSELAHTRSELAALRQSSQAASDALRASLNSLRAESEAERVRTSELQSRLAAAESRFDADSADLRRMLTDGLAQLTDGLGSLAIAGREEQEAHIRARVAELQSEMRERIERLLEEQRVCFRQLSLEASESAAALARARGQMEARLEAFETKATAVVK